ncbi:MAG: DUF4349 domain-containing protein [Clostridiales bacterium]|nr:DUF4349 domain-containing protein [Clostridiales bacterium]
MKKRTTCIFAGIILATAVIFFAIGCLLSGLIQRGNFSSGSSFVSSASRAAMASGTLETAAVMDSIEMEKDTVLAEEGFDAGTTLTSANDLEPSQPADQNRKLIRTVDLTVETTDFSALLDDLQTSVSDAGGYIENSNISGNSIYDDTSRHYASFTVRIPAQELDNFISHVGNQGNITNQSENVEDVTLQYTDIESHKKSLSIEQERLWELMEKADSMDAIIALEERLSEIRYQLESYESRLRTYDNQVDYSTVHINVTEVRVLTPTIPDSFLTRIQKGFQENLAAVCNSAVNLTVWVISSLPSLIVLAVIIFILISVIRSFLRKRRSRIPKPEAKEPDNAE